MRRFRDKGLAPPPVVAKPGKTGSPVFLPVDHCTSERAGASPAKLRASPATQHDNWSGDPPQTLRLGLGSPNFVDAVGGNTTIPEPSLVIACGALARELHTMRRANNWRHLHIHCLDARLHNHPALIPERLRVALAQARGRYRHIFVAYADCGTYGEIDRLIAKTPGVERLPGLHCYEFFAGSERLQRLLDAEPGTFFLTDFLVRSFDRIVLRALLLDRHPELMDQFFGNYQRVVYLSQTRDNELLVAAQRAATTLGLEFHHLHCGHGALETSLASFAGRDHAQTIPTPSAMIEDSCGTQGFSAPSQPTNLNVMPTRNDRQGNVSKAIVDRCSQSKNLARKPASAFAKQGGSG